MGNEHHFIHHGARVLWDDPANADYGEWAEDHAKTPYVVYSVNGSTSGKAEEDNDTVLIYDPSGCYGEAEVPARELRPCIPTSVPEDVARADAFLLSMIRHADNRMKSAERKAEAATDKLNAYLHLSKEERKELKRNTAYAELKAETDRLKHTVRELRNDLTFYRSHYLLSALPPARRLETFGKGGFTPSPEHIGRFLAGCPASTGNGQPVEVAVEDGRTGELLTVTGIRYDEGKGTIIITTN